MKEGISYPAFFMFQKGGCALVEEVLRSYYLQHEAELEDLYLEKDPGYQEREKELRDAVEEMERFLEKLGHEAWQKFDRVLTAHNNCEAYALRTMYVRGGMDALKIACGQKGEDENAGDQLL